MATTVTIHNQEVFAKTKDGQKINLQLISSEYTDESHWILIGGNKSQSTKFEFFQYRDKWFISLSAKNAMDLGIETDANPFEMVNIELFMYSPKIKELADAEVANFETVSVEGIGNITFRRWGSKGRIADMENKEGDEIEIIHSANGEFSIRAKNHAGLMFDRLNELEKKSYPSIGELTPFLSKYNFIGV